MEDRREDEGVTSSVENEDPLTVASHSLETAEAGDDPARLAALDSLHARLADELDKPAPVRASRQAGPPASGPPAG